MDIATCIIILLTLGVGQGEAIEIQADGPYHGHLKAC